MKEYNIHIPVNGALNLKVCADNPEDVLDIIEGKLEQLLYHPNCVLQAEFENIIMYETKEEVKENKIQ